MTTQVPTVSVLLSVYNEKASYLHSAIKSILSQTLKDFEFIIINDGSNQETTDLLKDYAKSDHRIRLIQNTTNIGLTCSLNKGIAVARGQFIARMDSDDIALPNRLEEQHRFLRHYNYDIVTSDYAIINENNARITTQHLTLGKNIKRQLMRGNVFAHSTFFGTQAIFSERYNQKIKKAQDYEFLLRTIGKGFTLGNLPKVTLHYRVNTASISARTPRSQEYFALKARYFAITRYGYSPLYTLYILRAFIVLLIPYAIKTAIITKVRSSSL